MSREISCFLHRASQVGKILLGPPASEDCLKRAPTFSDTLATPQQGGSNGHRSWDLSSHTFPFQGFSENWQKPWNNGSAWNLLDRLTVSLNLAQADCHSDFQTLWPGSGIGARYGFGLGMSNSPHVVGPQKGTPTGVVSRWDMFIVLVLRKFRE